MVKNSCCCNILEFNFLYLHLPKDDAGIVSAKTE